MARIENWERGWVPQVLILKTWVFGLFIFSTIRGTNKPKAQVTNQTWGTPSVPVHSCFLKFRRSAILARDVMSTNSNSHPGPPRR